MEPNLNTKNNVVMKEETDSQDEESSQSVAEHCDTPATSSGCTPPPAQCQPRSASVPDHTRVKQEEEPHETHSFEWCWGDKTTTITCSKAGTVEAVLKRSSQFREIAGKNRNKELVVVRNGKAISSHFPCSLIKNERLTVKYVKAVDESKQSKENRGSVQHQRKRPSDELVMFHVMTKGGKNVVKMMRNPSLKTDFQEMTVYAYKGEKVKQALKRDGRLKNIIFKKNCALSHVITEVVTEMSSLVDDLDGKTFKIILLNKLNPPDSQPGSLDDAYMMQSDSQRSDSDRNQDPPQQSTATESVNDNDPKEKPKPNDEQAPEVIFREMPDSKQLRSDLYTQFKHLVKEMKTQRGPKPSRDQDLFRVEFGKNAETCREVKTMKELMDLSNSVCQVRVNGRPEGSGFLLFDRFVLTNGHVVKNFYDESAGQPYKTTTVHFSFESLEQTDSGVKVEEVAGFEYSLDVSGNEHDWALLKLCAGQELPEGLLTRFGFLPQSGGICIIGHPDGGVKKVDPCLIIPTHNRQQVVERHYHENPGAVEVEGSDYSYPPGPIPVVTERFFEHVANSVEQKRQALTYESCFYFGASGSPVFDEHCNVVAMHTGGFAYRNSKHETNSVIEFGHPLSVIIEHIIVQMVQRGRFDVLREYLAHEYVHQRRVMSNLKKLFENRNLKAFKEAAEHPEVTGDESLKPFFEFLSQREEPVPMDTDDKNDHF